MFFVGEKLATKPLQTVLYKELSKIQAEEILVDALPVLEELINNGTHVLIRCADSSGAEENIDLSSLALYKHILEMTDTFSILIKRGVSAPTIPLLRSTLEALLSLEFIVEDEASYEIRSLQWISSHIRKKLKVYDSLKKGTNRWKELQAKVNKDKRMQSWQVFPQAELSKHTANLETVLEKDQFKEIQDEIERLKDEGDPNPNWYALFGGPRNLEQLANHLNRPIWYEVLYRQWSNYSHAQDFSNFIHKSDQATPGIKGLRDPSQLITFSRFGLVFIWEATVMLLGHFRPGEDPYEYYEKEIKDRFMKVIKSKSVTKNINLISPAHRPPG